jgi:hypothetical protein
LSAIIDAEVGEACERTEEAKARQADVSDKARLKGIRKNRQEEKARLREDEAWDMRPDGGRCKGQDPGEVVALPVDEPVDTSGSLTAAKRRGLLEAIKRSEREEGGT